MNVLEELKKKIADIETQSLAMEGCRPTFTVSDIMDLIDSVEQHWIPCSERLPDKTDDYLCSYNGCAVVDICEYDPDRNEWGFFYDGGWKVVSNVIAWMPLPEPYAERREE